MVHIQLPGETGTLCDPDTPTERVATFNELLRDMDKACHLCIDIAYEASYITRGAERRSRKDAP